MASGDPPSSECFPSLMLQRYSQKTRMSALLSTLPREWKKVSDGEAVQGCIVVSKDALENHKALVDSFLEEYKASVAYVNDNIAEAAAMIADIGIVPSAAVAEKAIPNCNIVYIDGDEMVSILTEFYKVLYDASPASVGGKLPDESLYYKK